MKKFVVKTLGCKANYSDGQLLEVGLQAQGFQSTHDLGSADLVVVNSCTVTDEADRQSQKLARDLARKNPNAKIIYTGCAAEVNPELALKIKGISAVVGNQNKDAAPALIADYFHRHFNTTSPQLAPEILGSVTNYGTLASRHPMDREWALPEAELSTILSLNTESSTFRTRAFIKVQEGCDSFCTYCIIPYGRGPARSLSIEVIVDQIKNLVANGIQEVILTGTNIGDYGLDFAGRLQVDALLEAILTQTALARLRIGSLDPTEISDRMVELMETYPAFCPHFHVSIQHVSSKILKLMKRKYNWEQVEATLFKLAAMKRVPFVGMDLITGFPGETDADFEESMERLKFLPWSRLHVFPYSERTGTPATKLPGKVKPEVRKERAKRLQAISLERLTRHYSEARASLSAESKPILQKVLLESSVKGPDGNLNWMTGYAPNYQRVLIAPQLGLVPLRNQIVDVQVSRWLVDRASGEVSWLGEKVLAEDSK